jgi:hypothetical protein
MDKNSHTQMCDFADKCARDSHALHIAGVKTQRGASQPSEESWRLSDGVLAVFLAVVVAWVALGCPT